MAPLSRSTFRSLLGDLDRDGFERFVAALWRARGYDVDHEDGLLIATGGDERRIWVRHPDRWSLSGPDSPPPAADTVVTSVSDPPVAAGREVIGVEDLYGMAFYGIDRAACTELFVEFFGDAPGDLEPAGSVSRAGVATAGLLLVAALAGAGVHGVTPGGELAATGIDGLLGSQTTVERFDGATTVFNGSGTTTTTRRGIGDTATDDPGDGSTVGSNGSAGEQIAADALNAAPGLDTGGIADVRTLGSTHADLLIERSYRLSVVLRKYDNGSLRGTARETARVTPEGAETAVQYTGNLYRSPDIIADPILADSVTTTVTPVGYAERGEQYVTRLLTGETSWIDATYRVNSRHRFVVGVRGSRSPEMTNVSARAVVDQQGIVHGIRRSHRVPGSDIRIVVAIEYSDIEYAADNRTAA